MERWAGKGASLVDHGKAVEDNRSPKAGASSRLRAYGFLRASSSVAWARRSWARMARQATIIQKMVMAIPTRPATVAKAGPIN